VTRLDLAAAAALADNHRRLSLLPEESKWWPPGPSHRPAARGPGRDRAGSSDAEIAEELFIGPATVKSHVSSILTKLGLRDRAQMVVFAYESGLVEAGERDIGR
jgi:hypothetical protein